MSRMAHIGERGGELGVHHGLVAGRTLIISQAILGHLHKFSAFPTPQ
jgi:hypothetical protein